ncbi:MAG: UDP-N-acetylmuramyl-tripeptide synthetase, partial [Acidobacteriota bacterium]
MLLRTALKQIPEIDAAEIPDVAVRGISYDSRKVQKGDLFVAIKGEKTDGALYVDQAVTRGAAAVASESPADSGEGAVALTVPDARKFLADFSRIFYGDPASDLQLAAVTGTNGKTTTTYLLDSIFKQAGLRSCLAGTIEMKTVSTRFESLHTTPEASDLVHFLHLAVDEGCTHGALEVSSHSLALQRVVNMKFKVGIFMNLTADHLDFHKTMKNYFEAKQMLFMPENGNRIEAAVVNMDDPYGMQLTDIFKGPIIRFGINRDAEIHVIENEILPEGTKLHVHTPAGDIVFQTRLIGRHNAYNIMAATGASLCMDIDLNSIQKGIES